MLRRPDAGVPMCGSLRRVAAREARRPSPPVVRKEIRKMSAAEQSRYADAVDKMMEAVDGEPGSSQYFRVASCASPVSLPPSLPPHAWYMPAVARRRVLVTS